MVDRYAAEGHHVRIVPHKNWLRGRSYLSLARALLLERSAIRDMSAAVRQIRPDLVYVNTGAALAGAIAAKSASVPCIWHLREVFSDVRGELHAPFGLKRLIRRVFDRYAAAIVVNSRVVADSLLGATSSKVHLVPNAVDDAFFHEERTAQEARDVFELPAERPLLGLPGTLRPLKGHSFFFRGMPALLREHPDLFVAITGDGEPDFRAALEEEVASLGLAEKLKFLGSVEDMPAFYRACDVICVPSESESFGRTVVEAMAVGTPVVATAVGGIPQIVTDGETGVLVPFDDEQALASAIIRLLRATSERDRICGAARKLAADRYGASSYKQRLLEIANATVGGVQ